jgi:hypothetical protein
MESSEIMGKIRQLFAQCSDEQKTAILYQLLHDRFGNDPQAERVCDPEGVTYAYVVSAKWMFDAFTRDNLDELEVEVSQCVGPAISGDEVLDVLETGGEPEKVVRRLESLRASHR